MGYVRDIYKMQKAQETASIVKMHAEGESIDTISKTFSKPKYEIRRILELPRIYGIDAKVKSVSPVQNSEINPNTVITVDFTTHPGVVKSNVGTITDITGTITDRQKIEGPFPIGELHIELDWAKYNNKHSLHYTVVDE